MEQVPPEPSMEASHLTLLQQGQPVDNTVVRVHSPCWRRTWEVPQQLISMTAASIARLMTNAVLPPPTDPSHLVLPPLADLGSDTALTSTSSLSSPAFSAAEHIQQAHDVLIGLASSHSAIKHWLYLRMFWLCQGQASGDALVLEKIAHVEGFAVNSAAAHRRWDRVKRGMAVMELLLNQRQALVDLVGCRAILLDQLIQLPARYLKELVLLHLVRQVRITEQAAEDAGGAKLTVARLEKMCKLYVDPPAPAPEPDVADTAAMLVSASHRRRSDVMPAVEQSSAPAKRLRTRPHRLMAASVQSAPKRRARIASTSVPCHGSTESSSSDCVASPSGENEEDDGEADNNVMEVEDISQRALRVRQSPVRLSLDDGSEGNAAADEDDDHSDEHELGAADDVPDCLQPSAAVPAARILHDAYVRMHSMPVLTYYLGLLRQFPDLLSVAAPYGYTDDGPGRRLYDHTIQHRLQDQCASRLLLYTNEYLLQHSGELQLLPALMVDGEESLTLCCSSDDAATAHAATKVWLFFPDDEEGDLNSDGVSNSAKALAVYHRFYSSEASSSSSSSSSPSINTSSASTLWDEHGGRLASLPAELLLQAGVRVLLVVQRAGETVSMPGSSASRYGSPCAHMVHTLPSAAVLSVAGNYCSAQHLVDHVEHQWAVNAERMRPPAQQMESVDVKYPAGVFCTDSALPAVSLMRPSQRWLQERYKQMGDDPVRDRQAWASELQTPEQMMCLINAQLDHDIAARASCPPPSLLLKLGMLVRKAPTDEDASRLLALYTKAIAMTASASQLPPHSSCGLRYGCGVARQADVPPLPGRTLPNQVAVAVFCFSSAAHLRPLLFLRSPKSIQHQQRRLAEEITSRWSQGKDSYRYNISWPTATTPSSKAVGSTVNDGIAMWRERNDYRQMEQPTPFLRHHLHSVHTAYLQDICAHDADVREDISVRLSAVLPSALIRGGALRHCLVPTDGVHRPSFYLLRSSGFALAQHVAAAALTDVHNESQRLGFWHHLLPCDAAALEQQHRDSGAGVLDATATRERLDAMYKLYSGLTKLPAAADAFARTDRDRLSAFVSTSYGELTQASVGKMVDCMVRHGLRHDDVFLDVGSGYGRVVAHVALATGLAAVGIEAVPARHLLAKQCAVACSRKALDVSGVQLHEGDVLANLHLLLSATHVLVFDARFQPETRAILRHLWCHLAGSRLRLLFCVKTRATGPPDVGAPSSIEGLELVEEIDITTGQNKFIMCAYRAIASPLAEIAHTPQWPVEVAVWPNSRVGLRARRAVAIGEPLLRVVGQRLSGSGLDKLRHEAADTRWQWMLRRRGEWTHVLNTARFANGRHDVGQANARYVAPEDGSEGQVFMLCSRAIEAGEEVVACCGAEHCGGLEASEESDAAVVPWQCYLSSCKSAAGACTTEHSG